MEEKIYERQIAKLSLSERVVDERQIERHYTSRGLSELYNFKPNLEESQEIPMLPKDRLLADILETERGKIDRLYEHDSLLENKVDEELTEEERRVAWQEYQQEKDRQERAQLPPPRPSNQGAASSNLYQSTGHVPNLQNVAGTLLSDEQQRSIRKSIIDRFPDSPRPAVERMIVDYINKLNMQRLRQYQEAQRQHYAVQAQQAQQLMDNQGMDYPSRQYTRHQHGHISQQPGPSNLGTLTAAQEELLRHRNGPPQ